MGSTLWSETWTGRMSTCWFHCKCSALPISRDHFSPNNSRKTSIARPLGWGMGVVREFQVWPKFYLRSCCAGCNIVLYCTAIYWDSIIMRSHRRVYSTTLNFTRQRSWKGQGINSLIRPFISPRFSHIFHTIADEIDMKLCGCIHYGTFQTWITFSHASTDALFRVDRAKSGQN